MKKRIAILAILLCGFFAFAFSTQVDLCENGFDDVEYEEVVIDSQ